MVDHGGVTPAARALYLAQPSLSQAIRGLEGELGVELFDRSGRSLRLTEAGRTFEVGARAALRDAALARGRVEAVRDLRAGRLRVATTSLLALDPLPQATARLQRLHPGVQMHVSQPGSSADVVTEVRLGRAELGLIHLDVATGSLARVDLGEQEFGLVMTPAVAAGLPDPFPLDRLEEIPMIADRGDSGAPGPTDDVLRTYGGDVVVWSDHPQATRELVRLGVGAAVLPTRMAEQMRGVRALTTRPRIARPVGLVHRQGTLSPAATAFIPILADPTAPPTPTRRR